MKDSTNNKKIDHNLFSTFKLIWSVSNKKGKMAMISLFILSIFRTLSELLPPILTAIMIAKAQNLPYMFFGVNICKNLSFFQIAILCFASLFLVYMLATVIRAGIKFFGTKSMGNLISNNLKLYLSNSNKDIGFTNGEISYIMKNSAESIPNFIETFLTQFYVPLITIIITLIYILSLNYIAFFIVLATIILFMFIVRFRVTKNKKILNNLESINGKINNVLLNNIENKELISFSNTKNHEVNIINNLNEEYYKQEKKRHWVYVIYYIFMYIVQFTCAIASIYFIMKNESSQSMVGILVVFIPYLIKVFLSSETLGFILVELEQYAIKVCRSKVLSDKYIFKPLIEQEKLYINKIKVLNYKKIQGDFVLQGDIVNINKNQINCIVGESGSGKTTFVKCLLGMNEFDSAKIIINDNLEYKNLQCFSDSISVAFQEGCFFDRKIVENIMYPNKELNESINNYIKILKFDDIIKRDKNDGSQKTFKTKFSGGEKKRIEILRALSKKAQIYVFDEPTNELDEDNVKDVLNILKELKKDSIVIVISHDSRLINISENVINL